MPMRTECSATLRPFSDELKGLTRRNQFGNFAARLRSGTAAGEGIRETGRSITFALMSRDVIGQRKAEQL